MATLSVTIKDELLQRAEEVAASRNMTIEVYLSHLLDVVTRPPPLANELGPLSRACCGILPPMTDEERERANFDYRMEKYGEGLDIKFVPRSAEEDG